MESLNVTPYLEMPIEKLTKEYFKLSRPYRKALYAVLPPDKQMVIRPLAEARRGIVRDEEGKIIRSKEWVKERIAWLKVKKVDLEARNANIDAELKQRSIEIKEAN